MKKRFFILIALCFVFTSCISIFKTEPNDRQVEVAIVNSTDWELDIKIQRGYGLLGFPYHYRLGKESKHLILSKGGIYTIKVKSRFDLDYQRIEAQQVGEFDDIWSIYWDSFDGYYHIK